MLVRLSDVDGCSDGAVLFFYFIFLHSPKPQHTSLLLLFRASLGVCFAGFPLYTHGFCFCFSGLPLYTHGCCLCFSGLPLCTHGFCFAGLTFSISFITFSLASVHFSRCFFSFFFFKTLLKKVCWHQSRAFGSLVPLEIIVAVRHRAVPPRAGSQLLLR